MMQKRIVSSTGQACIVSILTVGQLETNCYIVAIDGFGYIIDPGDDGTYIAETVQKMNITPRAILLTHGHFDHALAAFEVGAAFGIPTFVSKFDMPILHRMQETAQHFLGYTVTDPVPQQVRYFEELKDCMAKWHLQVIHTPGHTPGSVSFVFDGYPMVFTGDTLFADGLVGDTSHLYGDQKHLATSLRTLMLLPDETIVFSGHGKETNIKETKEKLSKKGFLAR
ncbi:MAG: MBL fold metallo-hydrolase [Candidatus Gottesmanbacteria bacterium]